MDSLNIILDKIYSVVILEHKEIIIFSSLLLFFGIIRFYKFQNYKNVFIIILSLICVIFGPGIFTWFTHLGIDSFIEAQSFDKNDAVFFVTTFPSIIYPDNYKVLIVLLLIWFLLLFLSSIFFYFLKKYLNFFYKILGIVIIISFLNFSFSVYKTAQSFKSPDNLFNEIQKNFSFKNANVEVTRKSSMPLKTIVYVGESTSMMNMSLYGYFRNNTPYLDKLSEEKGFIKFNNMLSTHTHTSPSLLKALSLSYNPEIEDDSFYNIKRIGIVDVLNEVEVSTSWLSNQNQTGTWNYASNILSQNSDEIVWSVSSAYLFPNSISKLQKPYDHNFFLQNKKSIAKTKKSLTILHSLAGHGHYFNYIPKEYHSKIDNFFDNIENDKALFGSESHSVFFKKNDIEEYDSAIRYIDYSINSVMQEHVIKSEEPVVFIYFSDHGESVYTDRAHDSSRFLHEMIRVPFFIFFNDAAINLYNEKYKKISTIAKKNKILTLNNISKLISYLFDISIFNENKLIKYDKWHNVVNDKILIRNTVEGKEYISLDSKEIYNKNLSSNLLNDQATNLFIRSNNNEIINKFFCYHRSNSIAKALRGSIAGNCIEIDIVIENDNIFVYHPKNNIENYGLTLEQIIKIISKKNTSLWIDAKNINNKENCFHLLNFLKKNKQKINYNIFIEFPPSTEIDNIEIQNCMSGLDKINTTISYYLVDHKIDIFINKFKKNEFIKNISFPYTLYNNLKDIDILSDNLNFNTWFYSDISEGNFNYIIFNSNNDPNSN